MHPSAISKVEASSGCIHGYFLDTVATHRVLRYLGMPGSLVCPRKYILAMQLYRTTISGGEVL